LKLKEAAFQIHCHTEHHLRSSQVNTVVVVVVVAVARVKNAQWYSIFEECTLRGPMYKESERREQREVVK
jgi:hypothetical protein